MGRLLHGFRRSEEGVGAVEFALIAPVMILVMLASVEIPRAVMTGQRLARSARTMADLISRQNLGALDDVYAAGSAVTRPYDTSGHGYRPVRGRRLRRRDLGSSPRSAPARPSPQNPAT